MDPVSATPRVDLSKVVHPDALRLSPATVELVETDAALHESLVDDAWERLGRPGSAPLDAWKELGRARTLGEGLTNNPAPSEETLAALRRSAHAIDVPLGTRVVLPEAPLDQDSWTVIGAGRSDRIELARRLPGGELQRQVRRWPELVLANPSLAEGRALLPSNAQLPSYLRAMGPPADAPMAIHQAVDAAKAVRPPSQHIYEQVAYIDVAPDTPFVVRTGTWEELARELKLTRLRPLPAMPSGGFDAASLVDAAGPPLQRIVFAAESDQVLGTQLLVGANDLPPGHRATRDALELERISTWFDRLGMRTWRDPSDALMITTGVADSISNASAHGNADYALVQTGLRDVRTRDSLLNMLPRDLRDALRDGDDTLRRAWPAVLGHEVGHVATQQVWGVDVNVRQAMATEAKDLKAYAALAEHSVVGEAFSDLFGASYARTRDLGIRDLGRLRNGIGDLQQLQKTIQSAGLEFSGHDGTQLLTKPMLELQQRKGWDAVAEVTASATNRLGGVLGRGELDALDVSTAARALRDSAAARWGLEDDAVRAMTAAWQKLLVLR